MAGLDRESIMAAVATRLAAIAGLVTFSRRFRDIDKVSGNEMPAIFLVADHETPEVQRDLPTVWRLHLGVFIYAITSDPSVAPASVIAPLVRSVETALLSQPGDHTAPSSPTDLGGLCTSVFMGEVHYGEGASTGQGVAFIPLEILAPGAA